MKFFLIILFSITFLPIGNAFDLTIEVRSEKRPLPFTELSLINLITKDTIHKQTDFDGIAKFDGLFPHKFALICLNPGYRFEDSYKIDPKDTNFIEIIAVECKLDYPIKECPIGNKEKKVIRTFPNLMVTYSFRTKRRENKYSRKIERLGYRSVCHDGQEVLISASSDSIQNSLKLATLCDQFLFCKKHKHLFK